MNLELVEQIVSLMGAHPVSEILVEQEGLRVRVCRPLSTAAFAPPAVSAPSEVSAPSPSSVELTDAERVANAVSEAESVPPETHTLTAAMVGIFHHVTPPLPYAALVTPGQVVGSIESMKLMNDVSAEWGGRVIEVLAEEGAAVEYGQPLFRLAVV